MKGSTNLPASIESALKKDMEQVQSLISGILLGERANKLVLVASYLHPTLDDHQHVAKTDDKGELHHYRRIRNMLEYAFENDGVIKTKYAKYMKQIQAPGYLEALMI